MYDLHIGPDRSVFGSSLYLDRTDWSKQLRWTEPIGPGDTDGPDRTNSIGSIRLGLKSVGLGRYRSGPDRGCPYLVGFSWVSHLGQPIKNGINIFCGIHIIISANHNTIKI